MSNPHHKQEIEHFHHSKEFLLTLGSHSQPTPPPCPLKTPMWIFPTRIPQTWNHTVYAFISGFSHPPWSFWDSSVVLRVLGCFFSLLRSIAAYGYLFAQWHLGSFPSGATVSKAAGNVRIQWTNVRGKCLRKEFLGLTVKTIKLFCKVWYFTHQTEIEENSSCASSWYAHQHLG